jgi:ATP-dependent Zn protease
MEKKTNDLLEKNRHKLDILAEALLEHETLERDEIEKILNRKK